MGALVLLCIVGVVGSMVIGTAVGALLSLLTPLLPVLLLGGFAWAIYRLGSRRPTVRSPPPGFWS